MPRKKKMMMPGMGMGEEMQEQMPMMPKKRVSKKKAIPKTRKANKPVRGKKRGAY